MVLPKTTIFTLSLLLCAAVLSTGCQGQTSLFSRPVVYARSAGDNYKKGLRELKDENFIESAKFFIYVKSKFPFSRFATLAELRIADALFGQEKFLEAVDAYKLFIKFHPTHPNVLDGYAAYRVGDSYVKQIPSDWFLLPPAYEKDQSSTRDALRELKVFMQLYASSKYLAKVKNLHLQCIRRLAAHELYVAEFYLAQGKPKGTIFRLNGMLKRFPDAGLDPKVMLMLGETYLKLEKKKKAREAFASLVKQYPADPHSKRARKHLRNMGR